MENTPKKRGRPKGSKNRPTGPPVISLQTVCPACKGTDFRCDKNGVRVHEYAYENPRYGLIEKTEWRRMICECGNVFIEQRLYPKK